jgi:hypothetical protein
MNGRAIDELGDNDFVNHLDPFADIQLGPSGGSSFSSRQQGGDVRHRITFSGVVELPAGIQVAPIFRFRTAIPLNIIQGVDLNQNGINNDLSSDAFAFDGFDSSNNPIAKNIGACKTINCGRGTYLSQLNLRVSKSFRLAGTARVEAIGELFNVFNAINPSVFNPQRLIGTIANPLPNPDFMRPTVYAGDFRQGEQRVGQFGLRFTFYEAGRAGTAGRAGRSDKARWVGFAPDPPFFLYVRCHPPDLPDLPDPPDPPDLPDPPGPPDLPGLPGLSELQSRRAASGGEYRGRPSDE